MFPAEVHSANSTSATSCGSTKTASRGGRSPRLEGRVRAPQRAEQRLPRRVSSASLKPVPTRPT